MKKMYIIGILMLLTIMAGALSDFIAPASSGIMRGSSYNVTFNTTSQYLLNCTLNVGSVSTANTSSDYPRILNNSQNTTAWNITIGSTGLEDASNYILTATCQNASTSEVLTRSGITVDNTIPLAPTSLFDTKQTSSSFTITGTVAGVNTTGCSINYHTSGHVLEGTEPSCTHSVNSCSCIVTNAKEYKYTYALTATDGLNTSTSSLVSFDVEFSKSSYTPLSGQVVVVEQPAAPSPAVSKVTSFWQMIVDWFKGWFK